MSRIGKQPIALPQSVSVSYEAGTLTVTGPKGTLTQIVEHSVSFEIQDNMVYVSPSSQEKNINAFWGLYRALLQNMVTGVTEGFEKKLRIEGVGYRVSGEGSKKLILNLGYSHPISVEAPEGIEFSVDKNIIIVKGIDKTLVGQVAANIRAKRPPEPYKGKGVRYDSEFVRTKVGKKTSS